RVDQREGKYYRAGVSEQRGGDEPRDDQREIQWSTDRRPIPEHARLGKRSGRMAASLQSVDGFAAEIAFRYTSIAAANCLVVVAAVSAADSAHRFLRIPTAYAVVAWRDHRDS